MKDYSDPYRSYAAARTPKRTTWAIAALSVFAVILVGGFSYKQFWQAPSDSAETDGSHLRALGQVR